MNMETRSSNDCILKSGIAGYTMITLSPGCFLAADCSMCTPLFGQYCRLMVADLKGKSENCQRISIDHRHVSKTKIKSSCMLPQIGTRLGANIVVGKGGLRVSLSG